MTAPSPDDKDERAKPPINHCRFGRVWHSWQRGYVNCQMRVRGNDYCHHHRKEPK